MRPRDATGAAALGASASSPAPRWADGAVGAEYPERLTALAECPERLAALAEGPERLAALAAASTRGARGAGAAGASVSSNANSATAAPSSPSAALSAALVAAMGEGKAGNESAAGSWVFTWSWRPIEGAAGEAMDRRGAESEIRALASRVLAALEAPEDVRVLRVVDVTLSLVSAPTAPPATHAYPPSHRAASAVRAVTLVRFAPEYAALAPARREALERDLGGRASARASDAADAAYASACVRARWCTLAADYAQALLVRHECAESARIALREAVERGYMHIPSPPLAAPRVLRAYFPQLA
jgi:hypothetical protein